MPNSVEIERTFIEFLEQILNLVWVQFFMPSLQNGVEKDRTIFWRPGDGAHHF